MDITARLVPWPRCDQMQTNAEACSDTPGIGDRRLVSGGCGARVWALAETPYPIMRAADETIGHTDFSKAAAGEQSWQEQTWRPLPFATSGAALGAAWALRLTAYFEVVLQAPTAPSAALSLSARASRSARPVVTVGLCGLENLPEDPINSTVAIDRNRLNTPEYGGQARWCALSCSLDAPGAPAGVSDGAGRVVLRYWDAGMRRLREEALAVAVEAGDTVGCGIDYAQGSFFWTKNGKLISRAGVPRESSRVDRAWRPVVGIEGGALVLLISLSGPFAFDIASHEARVWAEATSSSSTKVLLEGHCMQVRQPDARGWPSWEDAAERCIRPWLVKRPSSRKKCTSVRKLAVGYSEGLPTDPRDTPSDVLLWPAPDPLALTVTDIAPLCALLERCGLPATLSAKVHAAGLCVGRLATLAHEESMAALSSALTTGQRVRLKHGLQCTYGQDIELRLVEPQQETRGGAAARQGAPGAASQGAASHPPGGVSPQSPPRQLPSQTARLFHLAAPCLLVVMLRPSLPVRCAPSFAAEQVARR